jgi:hypothetical protein
MSLSDLASLGSFVSGIAVLASLIYLTFQLRQAERYQKASVQQARSARLSDSNLRLAEPAMVEVFNKGNSGDAQMSLTELGQFRRIVTALLYNGEDTFRMHEAGLISDDVFDAISFQIRFQASQPGWRVMWKQIRPTKGSEFRDFIDDIVASTPVAGPIDDLSNGRAAVAAERSNVAPA